MNDLGIDPGDTNIKAALVNGNGQILKEASRPTALPRPAEAVCDDIAALCAELADGESNIGVIDAALLVKSKEIL